MSILFRFTQLTDFWHLRDPGEVRVLGEARLVVVDVVDFDDELGVPLQSLVGEAVHSFSVKDVEGLLLSVQSLCGMDVSGLLIDFKQRPGSFSG